MVFFLMPPLMVLLVAGTLAQRWMGLYGATKVFFGSFVIWLGWLPLPGGYLLMGVLSLNLALKFLLKSAWRWKKAGIILTHLGALILMLGGLMTAMFARESYMVIPEGGETSYMYDYNTRSLVVFEDAQEKLRLPYAAVAQWEGAEILKTLPFRLGVVGWCDHCDIVKREALPEEPLIGTVYQGMAARMALRSKPPEKEPEANLTGVTMTLDGVSNAVDGVYIAFDGMPKPIQFEQNGHVYRIIFGKDQRALPFSLTLKAFERTVYEGTDKPKAYYSDIMVQDGNLSWPVRIEMNKPFRYRGYTFFQSSFEQGPDFEATVLAVVENKGRLFPYIGTGVIGLGLALHLGLLLFGRRRG